jgi:hypothetical protein
MLGTKNEEGKKQGYGKKKLEIEKEGRITEEAKRRRSWVSKDRLSPFRNGSRYSLTVPHYQVNG